MLWVYGVISHIPPGHTHFPAQSHAHTCDMFVPAKRTNRVADLQEHLFSLLLFFLD